MDLLDRLLEHDRWATTHLLELSRDLTDAQLDQEFDVGHRTLRGTFDHLISNVGFWTWLMAGKPPRDDNQEQRSMSALIERHERNHEAFAAMGRRMRDEQRLEDTFVDHYDLPCPFGGTIIHVTQHNVEHRTEVLHILQRLGVPEVPEVDHLLWEHIMKGH